MAEHCNPSQYTEAVVDICRQAAEKILAVYADKSLFEVETKADDSPVTRADIAANAVIVNALEALTPDIPILTEESSMVPFETRKKWSQYWLVDPLDGTKEFIRRNDQFTVNIALIREGRPIMGVVYVPVGHVAYVGVAGEGAYKIQDDSKQRLQCRSLPTSSTAIREAIKIVASANHSNPATENFINIVETRIGRVECRSIGSSLKFCLLAEGEADVYPRLAPTSEWDTGAAQAVLAAAGGAVYQPDARPLVYNSKASILNPYFYAVADPSFDWESLILESI